MKKHQKCLFCGSLKTRRNGKINRQNKEALQRFRCLDCRKSFTLGITKKRRLSKSEQIQITRDHLEGRTPIRALARHTRHSKTTIVKTIHEITAQCASASWIAKELKPEWGGYLGLDGKIIRVWDWAAKHFRYTKTQKRWLHKMSLLIALDLKTLDVPNHHLGDDETTIDLVMMLQELKKMNYPLKGYVTDGNEDIKKAVELVFGSGIPRQLCIRHYLQNLKNKLWEGDISEVQYKDACRSLLNGCRPKLLQVPDDLFTFKKIASLPTTNQQIENLIRYFNLRLKTISQFQSWQSATDYCNALVLMRRFTKFTDSTKGFNGYAPLELAGCKITNLDYLNLN